MASRRKTNAQKIHIQNRQFNSFVNFFFQILSYHHKGVTVAETEVVTFMLLL